MDLYDSQTFDLKKKGQYMDKDGCDSSKTWNNFPYATLDDVVISVCYWG